MNTSTKFFLWFQIILALIFIFFIKTGQASENDYYNKIATCVLTDCQVDYTPGGVRSFDDGSPTQIKMSLSFMETQLLTKEIIAQRY